MWSIFRCLKPCLPCANSLLDRKLNRRTSRWRMRRWRRIWHLLEAFSNTNSGSFPSLEQLDDPDVNNYSIHGWSRVARWWSPCMMLMGAWSSISRGRNFWGYDPAISSFSLARKMLLHFHRSQSQTVHGRPGKQLPYLCRNLECHFTGGLFRY